MLCNRRKLYHTIYQVKYENLSHSLFSVLGYSVSIQTLANVYTWYMARYLIGYWAAGISYGPVMGLARLVICAAWLFARNIPVYVIKSSDYFWLWNDQWNLKTNCEMTGKFVVVKRPGCKTIMSLYKYYEKVIM